MRPGAAARTLSRQGSRRSAPQRPHPPHPRPRGGPGQASRTASGKVAPASGSRPGARRADGASRRPGAARARRSPTWWPELAARAGSEQVRGQGEVAGGRGHCTQASAGGSSRRGRGRGEAAWALPRAGIVRRTLEAPEPSRVPLGPSQVPPPPRTAALGSRPQGAGLSPAGEAMPGAASLGLGGRAPAAATCQPGHLCCWVLTEPRLPQAAPQGSRPGRHWGSVMRWPLGGGPGRSCAAGRLPGDTWPRRAGPWRRRPWRPSCCPARPPGGVDQAGLPWASASPGLPALPSVASAQRLGGGDVRPDVDARCTDGHHGSGARLPGPWRRAA